MYKAISKATGLSYGEVQQKFKGFKLNHLRGNWVGIDPDTGRADYLIPPRKIKKGPNKGEPNPDYEKHQEAQDILEEIGFFGSLRAFIESP